MCPNVKFASRKINKKICGPPDRNQYFVQSGTNHNLSMQVKMILSY